MNISTPRHLRRLVWVGLMAAATTAVGDDLADGKRLFATGHYDSAIASLRAVAETDPTDAEAAFYLGRAHFALERWDEAVEWLEKAVELAPRQAAYHHRLGQAYGEKTRATGLLGRAGPARRTRQHLSQAVALDPRLVEARSDLVEFYLEAPGFLGGGVDKALEEAAAVRALDEREGLRAYAKIYREQENEAELRAIYEEGVRKYPDLGRFLLELGYLREREGDVAGALALFDRLSELEEWTMTGCYQVGRVAAISGQGTERGAACLEAYVEHRPEEDMPPLDAAWYRLGQVHRHRGNTAGARAAFEQCLRLNPRHRDAKKALRSLPGRES